MSGPNDELDRDGQPFDMLASDKDSDMQSLRMKIRR